MSRYFSPLKMIEAQQKADHEDLLRKVLSSFGGKKSIKIESFSELEYLWSNYPNNIELKKNFIYPFDKIMKDVSNISYSKDIKDLCAEILLNHFKDSGIDQIESEAEVILKNYFSEEIDYLKNINIIRSMHMGRYVLSKWVRYGLANSKDPLFYEDCMVNTDKKRGYLDKKYMIAKAAVKNSALSSELNQIIARSVTKRRAKDLCWEMKSKVDKRLGAKKSKHFYNLKHKYKKSYEDEGIISDLEAKLCVLLSLRRGEDVCDIVTSFLPEKYCVFIFPLCTNNTSVNNLRRRLIIR